MTRTVEVMSDDSEDSVRGPVMLAATNMLTPPPAVIGSLNKEITLPRTVRLTTVVVGGAGAILGFAVALMIFGVGIYSLMYGPTVGGAIGWMATNLSPLQGESLAKWLGLQAGNTRKRKLVVDGRPVRLYVGIAPLRRTAAGRVRMLPGGVPVDAVRWDDRGVPQQELPGGDRLPEKAGNTRKLTASSQLSSQNLRPPRGGRNK